MKSNNSNEKNSIQSNVIRKYRVKAAKTENSKAALWLKLMKAENQPNAECQYL